MKLEQQTKKFPLKEEQSVVRQALPQICAICVKNILLLGFGMTLGFPTILIPGVRGNVEGEKIHMGLEAISWISSINLICVPLGCLVSGFVTQTVGRRRAMQIVNIPFLASWLLYHFSATEWQIFLASCLTGLTGGLLEAPVLTYVAEVTQPHMRGILGSTSTLAVVLGLLTQFLLGTFLNWRTVAFVNCSIPVASFTALMFIPETPIWLITKNRLDEARRSMAWLRGWTTVENIEDEFQELYKHIVIDPKQRSKENSPLASKPFGIEKLKLFTKKNFYWPFSMVALAFFLSHFNGNTTLGVYAIQIFSVLKAPISEYWATVIMGTVQLLACIICVLTIRSFGKRVLNFFSLFTSAACFFGVSLYAYFTNVYYLEDGSNVALKESPSTAYQWIPVTFLVLSAFLSYIGIKILPWILIAEVYSNETRATAAGLSSATGYVFGFIANKIFLSLVSYITLPGVFLLYALLGLVGTIILYFTLPETEGKTLFEISEHFAGRNKLNNIVRRRESHKNGKINPAFGPDEVVYEDIRL